MSSKLRTQIEKLRLEPRVQPVRVPVLLSDSKGFNLKNQVRVNPETFIRFWCKAGATAEDRLQYLKDNLQPELQILHNITLYVWLGTCNLTLKDKEGKFLKLSSRDNSAVLNLISKFKEIYHCVRTFGNQVKLVFLRVPIYSISKFNEYIGYKSDSDERDDRTLAQQIDDVNMFIEDTNRLLHAYSPKFSQDLQKSRSCRKRGRTPTYTVNYALYRDGLHPIDLLAKLWLIRLTHLVKNDCYSL